jgi:hypothetical protein
METHANSTQHLAEAAKLMDLDAILQSEQSVQEDVFHLLSIAACRIGYNQNPRAADQDIPIGIPASIGIPLLTLSQQLHREPAVGYASLVLDNCVPVKNSSRNSIGYNAWEIQRTITSPQETLPHRAEKGFYSAHCAVEKAFVPSLTIAAKLHSLSALPLDLSSLKEDLREMAYGVRSTIPVIRHMRHFFIAEHFFFDLRPFLKCGNTMDNGMIFETPPNENSSADSEPPQEFTIHLPSGSTRTIRLGEIVEGIRGPTGAMTSALSALDALLQIDSSIKSDPSLEATMNDFREFQPKPHVEYLKQLPSFQLRTKILDSGDTELMDIYNDVVTAVAEFRIAHIDHIMTYIFKSIPHAPPKVVTGTGNAPIVSYLCKSAIGTLQSRLKPYSKNIPSVSLPAICIANCLSEYGAEILNAPDYCSDFAQTLVSVDITSLEINPRECRHGGKGEE